MKEFPVKIRLTHYALKGNDEHTNSYETETISKIVEEPNIVTPASDKRSDPAVADATNVEMSGAHSSEINDPDQQAMLLFSAQSSVLMASDDSINSRRPTSHAKITRVAQGEIMRDQVQFITDVDVDREITSKVPVSVTIASIDDEEIGRSESQHALDRVCVEGAHVQQELLDPRELVVRDKLTSRPGADDTTIATWMAAGHARPWKPYFRRRQEDKHGVNLVLLAAVDGPPSASDSDDGSGTTSSDSFSFIRSRKGVVCGTTILPMLEGRQGFLAFSAAKRATSVTSVTLVAPPPPLQLGLPSARDAIDDSAFDDETFRSKRLRLKYSSERMARLRHMQHQRRAALERKGSVHSSISVACRRIDSLIADGLLETQQDAYVDQIDQLSSPITPDTPPLPPHRLAPIKSGTITPSCTSIAIPAAFDVRNMVIRLLNEFAVRKEQITCVGGVQRTITCLTITRLRPDKQLVI